MRYIDGVMVADIEPIKDFGDDGGFVHLQTNC